MKRVILMHKSYPICWTGKMLMMNLSPLLIFFQVWFQNRRSKQRRTRNKLSKLPLPTVQDVLSSQHVFYTGIPQPVPVPTASIPASVNLDPLMVVKSEPSETKDTFHHTGMFSAFSPKYSQENKNIPPSAVQDSNRKPFTPVRPWESPDPKSPDQVCSTGDSVGDSSHSSPYSSPQSSAESAIFQKEALSPLFQYGGQEFSPPGGILSPPGMFQYTSGSSYPHTRPVHLQLQQPQQQMPMHVSMNILSPAASLSLSTYTPQWLPAAPAGGPWSYPSAAAPVMSHAATPHFSQRQDKGFVINSGSTYPWISVPPTR